MNERANDSSAEDNPRLLTQKRARLTTRFTITSSIIMHLSYRARDASRNYRADSIAADGAAHEIPPFGGIASRSSVRPSVSSRLFHSRETRLSFASDARLKLRPKWNEACIINASRSKRRPTWVASSPACLTGEKLET